MNNHNSRYNKIKTNRFNNKKQLLKLFRLVKILLKLIRTRKLSLRSTRKKRNFLIIQILRKTSEASLSSKILSYSKN